MNLSTAIARAGPWLAPITPAYLIARSTANHLDAPLFVAIAAGATVEAVGIAVSHNALRAYVYNHEKRQTDPAAPLLVCVALAAAYLVIGISLTSILDIWPHLAPAAAAVFFILAAIAYVNLAIYTDQDRREGSISEAKAEAKAERQRRKAERKASTERPPNAQPTAERSPELDERLANVHQSTAGRSFRRTDVERTFGLGKTSSAELIRYGVDTGQITAQPGYKYTFTANGKDKAK